MPSVLELVEFVMKVEQTFGIEIEDGDAMKLRMVGATAAFIVKRLRRRAGLELRRRFWP